MTFDINQWWGISVMHGKKIGPKQWRATAFAFRRDTQKQEGDEFVGVGTTMNSADARAFALANQFVLAQDDPSD